MIVLIVGLVIFLGVHSVRIVAEPWRQSVIAARGEKTWKGIYSVVSLVGLVLIIWGFGLARADTVLLWSPPSWGTHVAWLLTAVAFILLASSSSKVGHIKSVIAHPMVAGVAVWAFAHLLANGTQADLILFLPFLIWAVVDYFAAYKREQPDRSNVSVSTDIKAVVIGLVFWLVFFVWLHKWLIGVSPVA